MSAGTGRDWTGHAETVIDRTDEPAATAGDIRDITRTLTEEPNLLSVDLDVPAVELAEAREAFPEGSFETVGETPVKRTVRANDLLGRAVANVLASAIEHNDGQEPQVEISVAGNNTGIHEDVQTDVSGSSERGIDSDGADPGLFLTASVFEQCGGRV